MIPHSDIHFTSDQFNSTAATSARRMVVFVLAAVAILLAGCGSENAAQAPTTAPTSPPVTAGESSKVKNFPLPPNTIELSHNRGGFSDESAQYRSEDGRAAVKSWLEGLIGQPHGGFEWCEKTSSGGVDRYYWTRDERLDEYGYAEADTLVIQDFKDGEFQISFNTDDLGC